jgi:hypothetical protein
VARSGTSLHLVEESDIFLQATGSCRPLGEEEGASLKRTLWLCVWGGAPLPAHLDWILTAMSLRPSLTMVPAWLWLLCFYIPQVSWWMPPPSSPDNGGWHLCFQLHLDQSH